MATLNAKESGEVGNGDLDQSQFIPWDDGSNLHPNQI
jgi:hypothetical protein